MKSNEQPIPPKNDFKDGISIGLKMVLRWTDMAKNLDELRIMLKGALLVEGLTDDNK